jgi:copper(I)-binding protein
MQPGATHLMLMGLAAPLKEGDSVPLRLVFEKAGAVTIALEVAPIGADISGHRH